MGGIKEKTIFVSFKVSGIKIRMKNVAKESITKHRVQKSKIKSLPRINPEKESTEESSCRNKTVLSASPSFRKTKPLRYI